MDRVSNEIDILTGLPQSLVGKVQSLARKVSSSDRSVLFRQGDPATHFFTLIEGQVSLCIGQEGHTIYTVGHAGEAFGWSSLTGCSGYTATAVSLLDSRVLKYDGQKLKSLLSSHAEGSLKFYQNLSRTLDNRLHQSYDLLASMASDRNPSDKAQNPLNETFELP